MQQKTDKKREGKKYTKKDRGERQTEGNQKTEKERDRKEQDTKRLT